jgi:peptidoglycan hydrolase-like protein with peptidoglycan-binding domain
MPTQTGPQAVIARRGDEGPAVVAVQYLLRAEGYALEADSIFGPITETAAMDFQAGAGLPANGVIDAQTWRALVRDHTLELGSRGDAVRAIKYLLSHWYGYDLTVDGVFDAETRAAVIEFQSLNVGGYSEGIVDEITWTALVTGP